MKKHLFLAAALMLSLAMSASVIIDETFAIGVTNLADATDWTTTGTLTTGDGRLVLNTPLQYSNTGGEYVLSGVGKAVQNVYSAGTNYIAYKQLSAINSGVVYLSYLYKGDGNQGQSQSEIIGLSDRNNQSAVKAWAGKQGDESGTKNPFRIGVTRVSTTGDDIQWCNDPLVTANTVTLVVLKYDFSTQAASLFINPTIGSTEEPTPNAIDSEIGTAKTSLQYLMFKHNGKSVANFTVGGIRVSTTWAEAVAKKSEVVLPALDAPAVGAASAIGAEEFTANWTAVENATGYKVSVSAGAKEIAVQNVTGQAKASATFYNMPVATELTYKVTAIGDGENYDDSEASDASAAFSTLAAPAAVVFVPSNTEWAEFAKDKGAYATGSFPTTHDNGYDFVQTYIELSKDEDGKSFSITNEATGERFTARAVVDKQNGAAYLALPAVASAVRADIYATAGTADKKMKVQQYNYSTNKWDDLQELALPKTNVNMVSITPNEGVVKLRLLNSDGSAKQVWKVVTYAATPTTLTAPVVGEATEVKKDGFTANWAAVAGATGYRVLVTSADTTIRANVDAEVLSMTIDQLKPETEYTVKVAAIGDDAAYVGSVLSEAKVVTTLSGTTTALGEVKAGAKARKVVIDGQLMIERNGELFNMTGAKVL